MSTRRHAALSGGYMRAASPSCKQDERDDDEPGQRANNKAEDQFDARFVAELEPGPASNALRRFAFGHFFQNILPRFSGLREPADMRRRLHRVYRFSLLVANAALLAIAQPPEAGRIVRNGDTATLIVDSGRPVDSAAITLAEQFGIVVSVEDPPYIYREDIKDVAAEFSRVKNLPSRMLVPKGGRLEVRFDLGAHGAPANIRALLQRVANAANAAFPFAYRIDETHGALALVPTRTRDLLGRVVEITPLMDRRVTIPLGTRTMIETARLMTDALSAQTGVHVSCCQSVVGGVPWGLPVVKFEAHDEPARSVLRRLIGAEIGDKPDRYAYSQRCDPAPSGWCVITLRYVPVPGKTDWGAPRDRFAPIP